MIASLLWPGVLSQPAKSSFHVAPGDLATWLLAVFALGALIAAGLAYLEQRKAGIALADQVEDQRKANALQAKVLERTLGALARQQAEQIALEHERLGAGLMRGLKSESGDFHAAKVLNESGRPIRDVVAGWRTPALIGDHDACLVSAIRWCARDAADHAICRLLQRGVGRPVRTCLDCRVDPRSKRVRSRRRGWPPEAARA